MRLARLDLLAYGPFKGQALDFSGPGIHVVLGRNEAGKSTTLRAITGLLFGIDARTPDAHVHKTTELRIGGVLEGARGERVRVVRRKGNTNTLLDDQEQPIDESVLRRLLGGVSRETFLHAFGLDHDTLEAGARALLEGRGDLGESLFDAGVGGGGEVQRLLAELAAEADRIYKPRASALPLNEALKSFAEATKQVRERQSLPEAFLTQERALAEKIEARDAARRKKSELEARRKRLERVKRLVPLERRRARADERLRELGRLASEVARVEGLRDRFVAYERALEQRRLHQADAARLADRVTEAARRAGIEAGADLGPFKLEARKEARIHRLLDERTRLALGIETARKNLGRAERELSRLTETGPDRSLAMTPTALASLTAAIDHARAFGDVEGRLAADEGRASRKRKELEARVVLLAAGKLKDPPSLDAFVRLRLPSPASVERLEARAEEIGRTIGRLDERVADLEKEAVTHARQIATLSGDFAPPDAAALRTARQTRDDAFAKLRTATDATARGAAELDVERSMRDADAVADRMIREADRVTSLARLRSEAEANERAREKVAQERKEAGRARSALDRELEALFADAKITATGFAEMVEWLASQAQIADAHRSLVEAEGQLVEEKTKVDRARRELESALASTNSQGDGSGEGNAKATAPRLADLVAAGTRRLLAIESARRATEESARAIAKAKAEIEEIRGAEVVDQATLAEVTTKLGELLDPLGIPVDSSSDEVSRSLEALRDLFDIVGKRADAEVHARSADAEARAFEADLGRALADLAPDLGARDLRDAAQALFARAATAREATQERAHVSAQLDAEPIPLEPNDEDRALLADPDAAARVEQELTDTLDDLDRTAGSLERDIGGLEKGLEQLRIESHAADAAATAQQDLSRIRVQAERWARVRLARVILEREIERYREENQAPLVASSSALFARLTLGAFSGIKASFDAQDRPSLHCVRAGGLEVDVAGLSDGTRDQLYLSLRLASLLRRAESAEPMPLVLDDVLIQLDDQRAAAALAVLAEVATRMQVLFFTHHARLVDLARAAVPKDQLVVHELGAGGAAPALDLSPA